MQEITDKIRFLYPVKNIRDYELPEELFVRFVKGVYHIDDIEEWKVQKKLEHMRGNGNRFRIMDIEVTCPKFRLKTRNNHTISRVGEQVKKVIRNCYRGKINHYFYDIILHTGDNFVQSRYIDELLESAFSLYDCLQGIRDKQWIMIKAESDYMPGDFPHTYPFSKDMDIVCTQRDIGDIVDAIMGFLRTGCRENCSVRKIVEGNAGTKVRIRVEEEGYLIYLFDINARLDKMRKEAIETAIQNRIEVDGYYVAEMKDELLFRAWEYIHYPVKEQHRRYIEAHSRMWDLERAKRAMPELERELVGLTKEILRK